MNALLNGREELGKVLVGISTVLLLLIEVAGIVMLAITGFMDEAAVLGFEQEFLAKTVSIYIPLILASLRGAQAVVDKVALAIATRPQIIVAPGGQEVVVPSGDTSQGSGIDPETGMAYEDPGVDMGDSGSASLPAD